jgi:hypothetical protein
MFAGPGPEWHIQFQACVWTCPYRHLYCSVIENFIWIEPHLRGCLSYRVTFLSQRWYLYSSPGQKIRCYMRGEIYPNNMIRLSKVLKKDVLVILLSPLKNVCSCYTGTFLCHTIFHFVWMILFSRGRFVLISKSSHTF